MSYTTTRRRMTWRKGRARRGRGGGERLSAAEVAVVMVDIAGAARASGCSKAKEEAESSAGTPTLEAATAAEDGVGAAELCVRPFMPFSPPRNTERAPTEETGKYPEGRERGRDEIAAAVAGGAGDRNCPFLLDTEQKRQRKT